MFGRAGSDGLGNRVQYHGRTIIGNGDVVGMGAMMDGVVRQMGTTGVETAPNIRGERSAGMEMWCHDGTRREW